jgi:RecA-family ATPase
MMDPQKTPDANAIVLKCGQGALRSALDNGWANGGDRDHGPDPDPQPDILPFNAFDAGEWEGRNIEPRRWLVHERIPLGEAGIVSGDGGTGKTLLMLQLAVAVAAERPDWLNAVIETHGSVLVFSAEEKLTEMHRRVDRILARHDLTFENLRGRLHFICDPDEVALGTVRPDGTVSATPTLLRLQKSVELLKPVLVVVENAAEVYPASEIVRSPISRFVRKLLGGLTKPSGATVALIQHPSVAGLQDGSGRSGSTGWNNAGRWRLNFTAVKTDDEVDSDVRQLEVVKRNYGRKGEKVRVRWDRGVFVPESSTSPVERAAAKTPIDDAFMRCLDAVSAQGRSVSAKKSSTYAPAVFEAMPEAGSLKSKAFMLAMERLLSTRRIKVEVSGPPSKRREILVRVTGPEQ